MSRSNFEENLPGGSEPRAFRDSSLDQFDFGDLAQDALDPLSSEDKQSDSSQTENITSEENTSETVSLDEHKRLFADFQNYRRRTQGEIVSSINLGEKKVLEDLLPLFDFMNMYLSNNEISDSAFKYLFSQLTSLQNKYDIKSYANIGDNFDPSIHEALESGDNEVKTITRVFSMGYMYREKVLRVAVVGVN